MTDSKRRRQHNSRQKRNLLCAFVSLQAALLSNHYSTKTNPIIAVSAFGLGKPPVQRTTRNLPRGVKYSACIKTRKNDQRRQTGIFAGTDEMENNIDWTDMKILKDLVVASSLSYLSYGDTIGDEISPMQASPYFPESSLLKPLAQMVEPKTESGATIFEYRPAGNDGKVHLVVACRGSATPINFTTNLRFKLVPLQGRSTSDKFLVHEGFQEATDNLWKLLEERLDEFHDSNQEFQHSSIVFTGHSLGSANAQLCATKYATNCNNDSIPLGGAITFGVPRLVNRALADFWNNEVFGSAIVQNYIHTKDPILRQNGPLWDSLGFGILGTEVPCEPYEAVAYQSESSKREHDARPLPLAWNILDHCNYLGTFVGPRLIQPSPQQ